MKPSELRIQLFIAGGGLGGCAAALFAAQHGLSVAMVEPCEWIGGQMTSQAVSALDEHPWIESFGATANYYRLRQGIRDYYRPLLVSAPQKATFNPGNCWVSRLAFEPRVALKVLYDLLGPYLKSGQIKLYTRHRLVDATLQGNTISSVTAQDSVTGAVTIFKANCYIDATELGDLLPLVGAEYNVGAEAQQQTGEPHAAPMANPDNVQSFTYPFIVQFCPHENHTIDKPPDYEENRVKQPYSLNVDKGAAARPVIYKMFAKTKNTPGSFWTYRRLIDSSQFRRELYPYDISLINWHSNDFRGGSIIDVPEAQRQQLLQKAKNLSLGFLYWLQTEAPRDDGGKGYPELKLMPEALGSEDGLSQFPYIRESRRIQALQTIFEQDIVVDYQPDARARIYHNSVGIGKYWLDIHKSQYDDSIYFADTRPFQIPLGALIPKRINNLIAGGKTIGTTHLSNGAYRLHPIEWAIGEAAAALAKIMDRFYATAQEIYHSPLATARLQQLLVESGAPIFWASDVPLSHPSFAAIQWLTAKGIVPFDNNSLRLDPHSQIPALIATLWQNRLFAWIDDALQKETLIPLRLARPVKCCSIIDTRFISLKTKAEVCRELYQIVNEKLYF